MSRTLWAWARLLGAAVVLVALVHRLGDGPFLDGLRAVDATALVAAVLLASGTTVCAAWRWRIVATGLGADLPLHVAVSAYYRSQFLNTVLPGGVVGDVHRGVRHGQDMSDLGRGLRAVAWERTAGQAVQAVITLVVLLVLPSPVRAAVPGLALALAVAMALVLLVGRGLPRGGRSRWARVLSTTRSDLRDGLLARRAWPGVVAASALVMAGHTATFVIAARTAGTDTSLVRLLPLAVLVLLAMVLPSIGGWGPREGVAAWAFAAAGLGAGQGVATAVVYGVMALVATLPGGVVVALDAVARRRSAPGPRASRPAAGRVPVAARDGGGRA